MFTTMVWVCLTLSQQCVVIQDDLGPYATVQECKDRVLPVAEVGRQLLAMRGEGPVKAWYKCMTPEELKEYNARVKAEAGEKGA